MLKKILSHNSFLFLCVSTTKSSWYFGRNLLSQRNNECIKIRQCVCILKILPHLYSCCLGCQHRSIWRTARRVSHQFCCFVSCCVSSSIAFLSCSVALYALLFSAQNQAASSSSHSLVFSKFLDQKIYSSSRVAANLEKPVFPGMSGHNGSFLFSFFLSFFLKRELKSEQGWQ